MAFIPSRAKKHDTQAKGELNMNSMMDMMTIILLFLLKSYSTQGALVSPAEGLQLPKSSRSQRPEKELIVAISQQNIMVNDIPVINIEDIDTDRMDIVPLQVILEENATKKQELETLTGEEFTHEVIIEGDEKTPYDILSKVMYTCGRSKFYKMRLLTIQAGQ